MGAASGSIAKITPPKPGKVFSRRRLFHALDDGFGRPVIWIKGCAGAGKTTAVVDYLEQKQLAHIWYQVDSGDADPASFIYYLTLAAKKLLKARAAKLPAFKPEYLPGLASFARSYFRMLFDLLPKPCALVLDNFDSCSDTALFHRLLMSGIDEIPQDITMLFISREDTPAEFAALRADDRLFAFNPQELQLTREECRQLFEAKTGIEDSTGLEEHLDLAQQMTEGWAAGIVLMLDSIADRSLSAKHGLDDKQVIFDYFAHQVFARLEPELQDFLLKTSLLPVLNPELVQQVCHVKNANRIFNRLIADNLFIDRHATARTRCSYHPLFRDFLRRRARETLGKYEIIDLIHESAVELARCGELEHAFALFAQIEDWHAIARLVTEQGTVLTERGWHSTLKDWIDKIPGNLLAITPWLQYWAGVSQQPFNRQLSRKYFTQAYEQFKKSDDRHGLYMAWCGIVETYILEWGSFKPLDYWISEMETALEKQPEFPDTETRAQVAAGMFSALMYRQPDHPRIGYWQQELHDLILQVRDSRLQIKMGYQLFFYYTIWLGDLAKAGMLAGLLRPGKGKKTEPATHTLWYALDGLYLWKCGEHKKSLQAAEKGLALAHDSGFHTWDALLRSTAVYALLSLGDRQRAQEHIESIAAALDPKRLWDVAHYHYLLGRLCWFNGDMQDALVHCETGLKAATASGAPYAEALLRSVYARVLFESNQKEKAVAVNNLLREQVRKMHARNMLFIALTSEAEFAFHAKSVKRATNALRQAFTIAREQELIKHAFWWPPVMARLCIKALEYDIETEFVKTVIRTHRLTPDTPPWHLPEWPWAIRIRTLGCFSLSVDDTQLTSSGKSNKRPLQLLKVILALGGEQVSQDKVIEAMWPDAEGDSARQSLHTTLHRLRKLLGEDTIALHSDYLSIDQRLVWIDFIAYQAVVEQACKVMKLVPSKENRQQLMALTEQAHSLYQGDFLATDAQHAYFLDRQQTLKAGFIQLMLDLGDYWQKQAQPEMALRCYRRGLEVDNVSETLYQRLISLYHKLDRNADAVTMFQQCRKNLSDRLGISPSSKTIELYKRVDAASAADIET